jgi:hypothetical protein
MEEKTIEYLHMMLWSIRLLLAHEGHIIARMLLSTLRRIISVLSHTHTQNSLKNKLCDNPY